ncbi:MAG: peptide methionine sulfoxide reductase [Patiriisocius sp.]|uniref:peptide methionine sulfoxide reductase n=1 Tax=Patiriisocius sp. TaxID=2822396 RepID=UPI003EF650F3
MNTIPEGFSEGMFRDRKYGITKNIFNQGKSLKIYGKELGGKDFISLNYYSTKTKNLLKPCEMPEERVIDFLKNVVIMNNKIKIDEHK